MVAQNLFVIAASVSLRFQTSSAVRLEEDSVLDDYYDDSESDATAGECVDITDWVDTDGDNCQKIVEEGWCHNDDFAVAGVTPSLACCGCGGGQAKSSSRDFILATPGTNSCPAGFETMESSYECRVSLQRLGIRYGIGGVEENGNFPRGCYSCDSSEGCDNSVWFNTHATGGAVPNTHVSPICKKKGFVVPEKGVVFFGDSDIDYWVNSTVKIPDSVNIGIGGATCEDVLPLVPDILKHSSPSTIVLVCGENDMDGGGETPEVTYGRFEKILAKLEAESSGLRVVMLGTKPEPESKNKASDFKSYDLMARKYAIKNKADGGKLPFTFIDVHLAFLKMGNNRDLYAADGVHMSPKGYSKWEEWTLQALADDTCVVWENGVCVSGGRFGQLGRRLKKRFGKFGKKLRGIFKR